MKNDFIAMDEVQFLVNPMPDTGTIPRTWNGTMMPFPRKNSVLDFFRAQVRLRPESVALKQGERLMTYGELDRCSDRVAAGLHRHGLQLEETVYLFLPHSCEFLAAVLGVLKAGGSYFPMDKDTAPRRLEFLLADGGGRLLISDRVMMKAIPGWSGKVLDVAQLLGGTSPDQPEDAFAAAPSDPNRRAYITYTSGSTGQPKGVEIEHHALTNMVCNYHEHLKLTAQDRASMLAYLAFDASVADIWPVLCAGGVLVIPPPGILLDPDRLIEWLRVEEITLSFVPTGLIEILFTRPWPKTLKLRFLITGGDRLRMRPPAGLPFVVVNIYGPTENTVLSTWAEIGPEDKTCPTPPIGRPISNTTAYVLDEQLQPVPVNMAGELYVGGEQVARGYLGRRELTAERFLPDPFSNQPDARMYRTGDWVRWLPGGELDFLGRKDGQIQIRGRRVELGEIEATIFTHEAVRQVCCVPWLEDGMPSGVIAHLIPKYPAPDLAELKAFLKARLPDYMVPWEFVVHESLPLTPQGKLDRAALMALMASRTQSPQVVPREGMEQSLAALWHSLLPLAESSPPEATFASLGGDSLLAIKLMIGVEEITGHMLEVSTFLIQPTFAGLCAAVTARMTQAEFQPVLPLREQGTRPPLFCLYGNTGDIGSYFKLAEVLGDDQPVFGIRSPALRNEASLPDSMEAAAAEVLRYIRKVQPAGAPALVGYSWGGLLAFEVARQLAEKEGVQCFVAVIGTMAPIRPTNFIRRLAHLVRYFPPWLWNLVKDQKHRRQRLVRWRGMALGAKQSLADSRLPLEEWGSSPVSRHLLGLMGKYRPPAGSGVKLDYFRERDSKDMQAHPLSAWQSHHLPDGGWSFWIQPPRVHRMDGDHLTILQLPEVVRLAQAIRSSMDRRLNPAP